MKEMTSESQLNLTSYYKELPRAIAPKTDFVERVAEKTGKNIATVRFWVMGKTKPSDPKDLEILSELTGIQIENLFSK
jgi:hypothetical protein